MVRRILFAVGMPMAGGVGLLYVMSVLKENGVWDVPTWLPFASTLLSFGTSALGIAFGTLSTSWDPDREGSFFGWAEVTKNWPNSSRRWNLKYVILLLCLLSCLQVSLLGYQLIPPSP
ncbi:unnamed protein product [Spirodela intermedia]|uniref:Uncharacterized protein n=1 Tax=Spirodela intermedia TaxID=51605 RepID=A0A7I8IHA8_SPIIN|nr:unnamed protein product [Spirodela intermedia]CAA6657104.1 unnamed protein product [Spirodela intermedia]